MLQSKRQNFHHSKLPNVGEIVFLPKTKEKAVVESFPLCDNVRPYSIGIHTCTVRVLKNNERKRFAGHYFCQFKN